MIGYDGNMTIGDAQRDVRVNHFCGGSGMLVSGLLWVGSGLVAIGAGPKAAMATLTFGGMFIFPTALLINRALGRSGLLAAGSPMGPLARESTLLMILSIPLAFVAASVRLEWFFPAMLVVVGGHYLPFATLFGMRLYYGIGLAMIGAGYLLATSGAGFATGAFVGGSIELLFAPLAYIAARREPVAQAA